MHHLLDGFGKNKEKQGSGRKGSSSQVVQGRGEGEKG